VAILGSFAEGPSNAVHLLPHPSPMLHMVMMMFGGEARQRTEAEYNELFAATGFGAARAIQTGTAFSILEAKPH